MELVPRRVQHPLNVALQTLRVQPRPQQRCGNLRLLEGLRVASAPCLRPRERLLRPHSPRRQEAPILGVPPRKGWHCKILQLSLSPQDFRVKNLVQVVKRLRVRLGRGPQVLLDHGPLPEATATTTLVGSCATVTCWEKERSRDPAHVFGRPR